MKKKLIICSSIIFTLIACAWLGIYFAHSRIIESGIMLLKNKVSKEGITLEYGGLDFTGISSPLHIKTRIDNIRIYSKNRAASHELNMDGILLDSDLLNKNLSLTLIGSLKSKDTMEDKAIEGVYEFQTPPVVNCLLNLSFSNLSDFNFNKWYSMKRAKSVSTEEIYYTYSQKEGEQYLPFTKGGPVSISLKEKNSKDILAVDLEFKFLNHLYIGKADINGTESMKKIYKLLEGSGASDVTFKVCISNEDNQKLLPVVDADSSNMKKSISVKVEDFEVKNNYYSIMLDGDLLKAPNINLPYFLLNLSIKGFDKMVSIYTDAIEITVGEQNNEKSAHEKALVKSYSSAIANTLKNISLSTEKDKVAITLLHKDAEILISNIPLMELVTRVQEQATALKSKGVKKGVSPW